MNELRNFVREDGMIIIIMFLFWCAYYLERIKAKLDAIHYIMLSKTNPEALKDL